MKNEITIKLTAAQVEIVSQVLTVVKDVMKWDEKSMASISPIMRASF